jgi:uncharacterized protein YmfQ (DUF2313 family)
VIVDPTGYRLDGHLSASRSPSQVAVERVYDLPRRLQAVALEDSNDPRAQPHLLDRTERIAGLIPQGLVTRVIKGFILDRRANAWTAFDLPARE